jgi:acetolactate synthase-1/2/3 large subunit
MPRCHRPSGAGAASAIVAALAAAGTRVLFGVPGGGPNLDVAGAAAGAGLPFVLTHGETAATIMAATCADLTGAPGAVVVTRGPGLASAINGIAHAALDRLPVVVIADTVPAGERDRISHQRLDQDALGRSVAKGVVTAGAVQPGEAAAHAVKLAVSPPAGPVLVTMDTGARDLFPARAGPPPPGAGLRPAGDPPRAACCHDLAPLAAALEGARRPVLICGPGALPHASAVRAAVTGSGIPALHTYRARGIVPDTAEEAAGLVTGGTMEWPLLAACDLIIGLGVDPAEMIPAAWDYAAPAVLVTEVPAGSTRYFTGSVELIVPLPSAIKMLAAYGRSHDWPPGAGRAAKAGAVRALQGAATAAPGLLSPQDVARTVREHTPPETIAAVDAGAHMLVAMPLWEVTEPRRLLISSGLATMGFALPAAIAAALCTPGAPVVAFTGDGGLGMTVMEIETAVRFRLRIVVVVFNDSALSLIKIKQRPAGQGGPEAVRYGRASFAAVATALGAAGTCVTDTSELAAALRQALDRDGPTVIDAQVDPSAYPAVLDLSRGSAGRRAVPGLNGKGNGR